MEKPGSNGEEGNRHGKTRNSYNVPAGAGRGVFRPRNRAMSRFRAFLSAPLLGAPAWLLLLALVPRLAVTVPVLLHPERAVTTDSMQYLELAGSLLGSGRFYSSEEGAPAADVFRTPGYPVFLAFLGPLPGSLPGLAALLQCFIGVFTVALAWRWFSELSPGRGAALGAILLAADMSYVLHTPLALTETLFLFLLVLSLKLFWPSMRNGSVRAAALAGLALGAATLVRPVSLYLPAVIFPFLARHKKAVAAFLAAALLLPCAWMARNRALTGHFTFSSIGGISLLRYPAANVEARMKGITWDEADALLRERLDTAHGPYGSPAEKGAVYMREAVTIIKAHPFICVLSCLKGAAQVLLGTGEEMILSNFGVDVPVVIAGAPAVPLGGTRALVARYPWMALVKGGYLLFLLFFYAAAARGLWRLSREGRLAEAGFLLAGTLYFLAISSYQGYYRFRIPMLPLLAAAAVFSVKPGGRPE